MTSYTNALSLDAGRNSTRLEKTSPSADVLQRFYIGCHMRPTLLQAT